MSSIPWTALFGDRVRVAVQRDGDPSERPGRGRSADFWHAALEEAVLSSSKPGSLEITTVPGHAPIAIAGGVPISVSFSVTAGHRACAWSRRLVVGVDLEAVTPQFENDEVDRMLQTASADEEVERIRRGLPAVNKHGQLIHLWTAKEAVLKSLGTGLAHEPRLVALRDISPSGCWTEVGGIAIDVQWLTGDGWILAAAVRRE